MSSFRITYARLRLLNFTYLTLCDDRHASSSPLKPISLLLLVGLDNVPYLGPQTNCQTKPEPLNASLFHLQHHATKRTKKIRQLTYRCLRVPFKIGLFDKLAGPDMTILASFDVGFRDDVVVVFVSDVAA